MQPGSDPEDQEPDGRCFIRDMSRNGTRVDGRRLSPNLTTEFELGQVLQVGRGREKNEMAKDRSLLQARSACGRAKELIRNLLGISRRSFLQRERCNAADLVHDTARMQSRELL